MPRMTVRNLKAADPGIGLTVGLGGASNINTNAILRIVITIHNPNEPNREKHQTNCILYPPINVSEDLVFVLPYMDSSYKAGDNLVVDVNATQGGTPISGAPSSQTVPSEAGHFVLGIN